MKAWWRLLVLSGLSGLALFTNACILMTVRHFLHQFVIAVMMGACSLPLIFAIFSVSMGYWTGSVFPLFCSVGAFLFLSMIRARVDFATTVLSTTVKCLETSPGLIIVALGAVLPLALWTLFVTMIFHGTLITRQYEPGFIFWFQSIYLLASVFWTHQVIKNIVHVTTANRVAMWFFYKDDKLPPEPTKAALKRSCTHSLGSIAFGSLLICVVQTARFVVERARKQRRFDALARVGAIVGSMMEGVVLYFNKYALVYVAVYGQPFLQSAQTIGRMVSSRGFGAVFNDDITAVVLIFVCLINAVLCYGGLLLIAWIFGLELGGWIIVSSLWIGYGIASVITSLIDSGVSTIYVCFMEDSSALRVTHINEYNTLASAWMVLYGGSYMAGLDESV